MDFLKMCCFYHWETTKQQDIMSFRSWLEFLSASFFCETCRMEVKDAFGELGRMVSRKM